MASSTDPNRKGVPLIGTSLGEDQINDSRHEVAAPQREVRQAARYGGRVQGPLFRPNPPEESKNFVSPVAI